MIKNCLGINVTVVANEFIDQYMAAANGEYVKVYLYLLRHQNEAPDIGELADALNHTEADVRRALGYWARLGVLSEETDGAGAKAPVRAAWSGGTKEAAGGSPGGPLAAAWPAPGSAQGEPAGPGEGGGFGLSAAGGEGKAGGLKRGQAEAAGAPEGAGAVQAGSGEEPASKAAQGAGRRLYTPEQVSRLAGQEDFTQLLYISQKYMNKVFTPRECEVFAYLYDALRMPVELLEYLVEYCVQNGHYSIRYLESVALNWHERGIRSVDMAKSYTASFSKEGFAVMRAFGISDRRPGESEQKLIDKWFKEFGFTRDIITEACSRTLAAIHKPSFSYADKILSDWKKGGVRVLADVGKMDERRGRENQKGGRSAGPVKPGKNQFHNFEQRGTNYDAMVLERIKERLGERQG